MTISASITQMAREARVASREIASADLATRNFAIRSIAALLLQNKPAILQANDEDMQTCQTKHVSQPLQDRLKLDDRGISRMYDAAQAVASLPDPIGAVEGMSEQPSGIVVGQMRIPLGVVGMIYESRPNVTLEAATLCIKSGNAAILRGGSESINSNTAIADCIEKGLSEAGLSTKIVQILRFVDREAVTELLRQDEFVDLIIPRGGKGLIEQVTEISKIPVLKHLDGVCHVYIDDGAEIEIAVEIAVNSKTSKYAVCNAMETLLIHQNIASSILPTLADRFNERGVEVRGCAKSRSIENSILEATDEDWRDEYLGPVLSVRIVDGLDHAISHIEEYGSGHTETIVTQNHDRAQRFLRKVDSATVMVNASTQFADGFEFGLGAEIGISTDKLHARGPVGLKGLTTQKYIVYGHGEVRQR